MQLTCPACGARYAVADDAIPAGGRMVRCSKCRAEWRATRPEAARRQLATAADAPAAPRPFATGAPDQAAQPSAPPLSPARSTAMAASLVAPERRGRSGFMAGFAFVTLVALGGVAIYARHAEVAAVLPPLAAPLEGFVALVDQARAALAEALAGPR